MADTIYEVELKEDVSEGLDQISKEKTNLDKQFDNPLKIKIPKGLDSVNSSIKKATKNAEKSTTTLSKLDKVLGMFSVPIGQIAGKFGMAGDAIEGATGKMIGMGGAAGIAGASVLALAAAAAVVIGAYVGMTKAALFADEQTTKFNKTVMLIRGSLGQYTDKTKEVIDQSMKMNIAMGRSAEDVSKTISEAVKLGSDLETAADYASLTNSMNNYGEAGEKVNSVLKQITSGKRFEQTKEDIDRVQKALNEAGVGKKIKAINFINEKDAKKQLKMILANKDAIKLYAKENESAVPAVTKLKIAFENMLAKVFGGQGKNQVNDAIDKIMQWMDDPSNIKKIQEFFAEMSNSIGKVDLRGILDAIKSIMSGIQATIGLMRQLNTLMGGSKNSSFENQSDIARKLRAPINSSAITIGKDGNITNTTEIPSIKVPESIKGFKRSLTPALPVVPLSPSIKLGSVDNAPTSLNYSAVTKEISKVANNKTTNHIPINIIAQEGTDPKQIARAVGIELTKRLSDELYVAGATV
jgi:hypothetical protein